MGGGRTAFFWIMRPFSASRAHGGGLPTTPPGASHIHEVDFLRAATCAAVVAVHALGMARGLSASGTPVQLVAGAVTTLLHYSREAFMIVTGLVLTRTYRQHFDGLRFYSRRFVARILPYASWTGLYLALGFSPGGPLWWPRFWRDLSFGSASYQLYYMVVAVQFYFALPALLSFLRKRPRSHILLLLAALAWQVAWYAAFVPWASHHAVGPYSLGFLQVRSLLAYPFFFVLGALWGWHLEVVNAALARHWRGVVGLTSAAVLALLLRYFLVALPLGYGVSVASSVFEPAMIPYAALITATLWLAGGALTRSACALAAATRRAISFVSGTSFGIYLIHVIVLRWAYGALMPIAGGPVAAWAILLAVTFGASLTAVRALGCLPWISGLLGARPAKPGRSAWRPPAA